MIRKNVFNSLNGEEVRASDYEDVIGGEAIYLLDHATSIHLEGELKDVPLHGIRQRGLLDLRSILEQLLDDVISEDILDELKGIVGNDLSKYDLLLVARSGLELLLNETRSMLIATKLDDVSEDIPQFPLASLVGTEILQERASKGDGIVLPSSTHTLREHVRTIQTIHPRNEKADGGIVVQGVTLRMRRWG